MERKQILLTLLGGGDAGIGYLGGALHLQDPGVVVCLVGLVLDEP